MSTNFSTIKQLSPATISKMPRYTNEPEATAASNPILNHPRYQEKKSSHWFLKTLAAVVVLAGGAALLRGKVDAFKNFDVKTVVQDSAPILDQAKHYGLKGVAIVGDFVTEKYNFVAGKAVEGFNYVRDFVTSKLNK